ncbi:MAG: hypothetical protein AB8C13_10590 [Phycisphaerales bacterium]
MTRLDSISAFAHQPALAGWQVLVESAESAATNLGDAKFMFIALCILVVVLINLRLASWLSKSIRFEPPKPRHRQQHPPRDPR